MTGDAYSNIGHTIILCVEAFTGHCGVQSRRFLRRKLTECSVLFAYCVLNVLVP